jgi:lysozyme family protein
LPQRRVERQQIGHPPQALQLLHRLTFTADSVRDGVIGQATVQALPRVPKSA